MKRALLIFSMTCQLTVSGFAQQPDKTNQQNPNPTSPKTEAQQPRDPQTGGPPGVSVSHQGEEDVVRITTNLVQIDPVITDRYGKQVTDQHSGQILKSLNKLVFGLWSWVFVLCTWNLVLGS
jgi:hypothetical protein